MADELRRLHEACLHGDLVAVRELLEAASVNEATVEGRACLHFASEGGNTVSVRNLHAA